VYGVLFLFLFQRDGYCFDCFDSDLEVFLLIGLLKQLSLWTPILKSYEIA